MYRSLVTIERTERCFPGVILADTLTEMRTTQGQMAKKLGVSIQTVNTLIKGKRSMTASIAVALARVLKTSAQM